MTNQKYFTPLVYQVLNTLWDKYGLRFKESYICEDALVLNLQDRFSDTVVGYITNPLNSTKFTLTSFVEDRIPLIHPENLEIINNLLTKFSYSKTEILNAIYQSIEVKDKDFLDFIRFDISNIRENILFGVDEGRLMQTFLNDEEEFSLEDLQLVFNNIYKARYFEVIYKSGCHAICENTWDTKTKQHILNILCQKVS